MVGGLHGRFNVVQRAVVVVSGEKPGHAPIQLLNMVAGHVQGHIIQCSGVIQAVVQVLHV